MRPGSLATTIQYVQEERSVRYLQKNQITPPTTSETKITKNIDRKNTKLDVLKQRAARFGVSVSSAMSNLENKEKLEKRKQRFGSDTEGKSSNGVSDSEKAKLRLERFKEPVK
ncbi:unnamed protein product [Diabrotica balteata]|uniref:THO1-MOS11 C-terminal domain-containing protein n=1 Tax=Diabrotica balteata TaxID=107213 RepID=A0A9N9SXI5_DIABA|nr:unnamed protein product [Diabrotica balteata]